MKTVLITAVGGNIGQGVVRNIIDYNLDIRIIGVDAKSIYPVKHFCDATYIIPLASDTDYIQVLINLCQKENVDLVIPVTEVEILLLSEKWPLSNTKIATSNFRTVSILLDKYNTFNFFKKNNIPFAETRLPSQFSGEFSNYFVKLRKAYSHRGVYFNPKKICDFNDDYVVQQSHVGTEITTGFYVTKSRKILGSITLEKFAHGINQACNITKKYDSLIIPIIEKIVAGIEINGCADLQAIITHNGEVWPFEVNCRLSGSNSIRSQFGFEDVKYILLENVFNTIPSSPTITTGSSVRVFADAIFKNLELDKISKSTEYYNF